MSDLLVREFDIPKPGKYAAALQIYEDGAAVLEVTWTRPFEKPRSTTCLPITILPKGHGRLIDADSMLSKYVKDVHGLDGIYDTTDLPEMLSYMPSIVPAEETLMETKDEMFDAVRTIKQFCERSDGCGYCDGYAWCVAMRQGGGLNTPNHWPDPEEGDK